MNRALFVITKRLYSGNMISHAIANWIIRKFDGGEYWSKALREIYKEKYDIDVGFGTYGCFTNRFRKHIKIGNYCSIANDVDRLVGNHPYKDVSTHPFFHLKKFGAVKEDHYEEHFLEIGHDVWIGTKATITSRVSSIGDGAVIGAGAVVTKNVEPYSIVAGVPARVIGYRFDEKTIARIEESKWFLLSPDELRPIANLSSDVNKFIDAVNKINEKKKEHTISKQ